MIKFPGLAAKVSGELKSLHEAMEKSVNQSKTFPPELEKFTESDQKRLKGISDHLRSKWSEWTASSGVAAAAENVVITGGCLSSLWHRIPVNDYDFFFDDTKALEFLVFWYTKGDGQQDVKVATHTSSYQLSGQAPITYVKGDPIISKLAITLAKPESVQIVRTRVASPKIIVSGFDFKHLTWYWHGKTKRLYISPNILNLIKNKQLARVDVGKFEVERQWEDYRVKKWLNRGWTFATENSDPFPQEIPY